MREAVNGVDGVGGMSEKLPIFGSAVGVSNVEIAPSPSWFPAAG